MSGDAELNWQAIVRRLVDICYEVELDKRAKARDALRQRCNAARIDLLAQYQLHGNKSQQYKRARHGIDSLQRQLNQAINTYDALTPEVMTYEHQWLIAILGQHLTGRPIISIRRPRYVLRRDRETGCLHIYFGGQDAPDGDGHGHYVLRLDGLFSYIRNPGMRHGSHNHQPVQQRALMLERP